MLQVQWWALLGSVIFLVLVIYSVYRNKLTEAYALLWVATGLGIMLLSLLPGCLNWLARWVGIQTPAFALLLLLFGGMLLLLFQLSVVISSNHRKIKRLTQEVTLLKAEMNAGRK